MPGRERVGHDEPRRLWLVGDELCTDLGEHEVAEPAARLPAVEAGAGDDLGGAGTGLDFLRLEPLDPGVTVPELAAPLGVVEVGEERLDVGSAEAERREASACVLGAHAPSVRTHLHRMLTESLRRSAPETAARDVFLLWRHIRSRETRT